MSKPEFEYLKIRIKKLENVLFDYENKDPLYLKYEAYYNLPKQEQDKLRKEWEEYYKKVHESPLWKGLLVASKAFKRGQVDIVKECAKRADEYESKITKPRLEDPEFLDYKMQGYHMTKSNLDRLKGMYEEFLPVYGSKADKEDSL